MRQRYTASFQAKRRFGQRAKAKRARAERLAIALAVCGVACSGEVSDSASEPAETQTALTTDTARTRTLTLQGYPNVRGLPATYSVGDRTVNVQRDATGTVTATLRSTSSAFCNGKRCNATGDACVAGAGWDCTCLELPDGPWCFHFQCEGGGGVSGPGDESAFPPNP